MKAKIITLESLAGVMNEVESQIKPILHQDMTPWQVEVLNCYIMTLVKTTSSIFEWMPSEEKDHMLTACATWFDIGMLFGKSPEALVKILDKVNPHLETIELPEWLAMILKAVRQDE